MNSLRSLAIAFAVLGGVLLTSANAYAQGTCVCNNGCHARPGQCVIAGSNGCLPGYAPFCGTRTASCPMMGWVSCSGTCDCVPIPGYDGGVADVVTPPDAPRPDVVGPDVPGTDAVAMDVPPGTDVPAPTDMPTPPSDTPGTDAPPTCTDGILIEGQCITERCRWNGMEIGWGCISSGTECRVIGGVPYCVPRCLGTMCAPGEVCDPANGCVTDRCPMITCDAGTVCQFNRCVEPDAGTSMDGGTSGDGSSQNGDGSGGDGGSTGRRGGCGCRTAGSARDGRGAAALGMLAIVFVWRRRRASRGVGATRRARP